MSLQVPPQLQNVTGGYWLMLYKFLKKMISSLSPIVASGCVRAIRNEMTSQIVPPGTNATTDNPPSGVGTLQTEPYTITACGLTYTYTGEIIPAPRPQIYVNGVLVWTFGGTPPTSDVGQTSLYKVSPEIDGAAGDLVTLAFEANVGADFGSVTDVCMSASS